MNFSDRGGGIASNTYELNGSYAESNGGPSLVPYGGTLGPDSATGVRGIGYNFGVQQGLSLSGTGIFDVYSIDIRFYFDDVLASFNTSQKILDFKNLTSDSGLYSTSGSLNLFATTGSGDPHAGSGVHDFSNSTMADLLVTRNASGLFSASVNGHLAFSVMDNEWGHKIFRPRYHHVLFHGRFADISELPDVRGWLRLR